jgi:hypothetical protein
MGSGAHRTAYFLIPTNTVFGGDSMDCIARKEGDHGIG